MDGVNVQTAARPTHARMPNSGKNKNEHRVSLVGGFDQFLSGGFELVLCAAIVRRALGLYPTYKYITTSMENNGERWRMAQGW